MQEANYGAFPPHGSRDGGRDEDHYPGSNYTSQLRHPGMSSTRPPVY
jgi:hypothetical protein